MCVKPFRSQVIEKHATSHWVAGSNSAKKETSVIDILDILITSGNCDRKTMKLIVQKIRDTFSSASDLLLVY